MKNMKKFITLCGFLILGSIACGDADVVKAEAVNEQTTDTSGYTITIPSNVDIDKDSGKGSFAITGKVKAQSTIDVSIQSKNGYKLKDKSGELPYNIDKKSFSIDNSRSASDISLNEEFNIVSKTNTKVSGYYTDSLTFDITDKKYEYELDVNGNLDENGCGDGSLTKFGRFDVYIDGKLVKKDADDFCQCIPYGSTWELKNIRGLDGYHYEESLKIPTKGVIGKNIEDRTDKYRTTCVNLKFYTNKLIINYHADGAQTWLHFDNITYDNVSGKDTAESEILLYDKNYSAKYGLGDVSRLKKDGYTAKPNTWIVGKNGTKEVSDNVGLAKSQDVAEYCGVLDEFKKNDTTIDLYPIWTANTYTLTYDLDGGSFNASTTQLFKYGSGDAISSEIPIKTGYDFVGWKWGDVIMQPGDTINKGWGNFTLTAQWEKAPYSTGTILNIEGSDYIVMSQTDDDTYLVIDGESLGNMQYQPNVDANGNYKVGTYEIPDEKRPDGQNSNTYEGSYIDNYLENTWYKQLPEKLQKAIQAINIKQSAYSNTSSNPKWRYFDPNGGSSNDWYYNEGTTENPKWVIYNKVNIPNDAQGGYPLNCWKQSDKGYNNTIYNAITRHVYLPSVEELSNLVDLNNNSKIYSFLKGTNNSLYHMWFRDGNSSSPHDALSLGYSLRSMGNSHVTSPRFGVRPAFVVDLSKIDYSITGTVKYK